MTAPLAPASISELVEMVRSTPRLLPVGAGTKPRLAATNGTTKISLSKLSGILEYDPSEFTFTALAGTPLREIADVLAQSGQYLPFDPPLVQAGATLGGTLAAGLSGPGRLRFGGVRDFILGTRFVDGAGRLLLLGGKVVKNAAGFDLPKFFVGSLGRFGVLAELTFKVFPQPPSRLTLKLQANDMAQAVVILIEAAKGRWEPEALELLPVQQSNNPSPTPPLQHPSPPTPPSVLLRLSGPSSALEKMAKEILARWPGEIVSPSVAENCWADLTEFRWVYPKGTLVKVPVTPDILPSLQKAMAGLEIRTHISAGGNVAYLSLALASDAVTLSERLEKLGLTGLTFQGEGPLWTGKRSRPQILVAVKEALDPDSRFPSLDD